MLFSMRHKTYAGQVQDVFLEASSLERATKVAAAYCKKQGHGLVFVKSAVVADESVLAGLEYPAKGACSICGQEFKAGEFIQLESPDGPVIGHVACPRPPMVLMAIVAGDKAQEAPSAAPVTAQAPAPPKVGEDVPVDRMAAARAAKAAKKGGEAA